MPRAWLVIILLAAGCTTAVTPSPSAMEGSVGGTLRAGLWIWDDPIDQERALLDPQAFFWHPFARCCLNRTLLSYEGRSIEDGGAQLRPDLAEAMPTVSADGLTWTFQLRAGLRYAPPFENREILARDFITALERTIRVGESPYHDVIEGVAEFRDGAAGTIAGAQAPDDQTIVFRLTEPAGDFGNRVAMTYLSPIPAEALAVHDEDYGGFLVSSGPYMIEGAETLDHDDPAATPTYESEGAIVLVRNPSWSRELDQLRPAYAERIEIVALADRARAPLDAVSDGSIDVMLDPITPAARDDVLADPELRLRLREAPNPNLFFIPLNLGQPPFDDVWVRRAVNVVIDRQALLTTFDPERGSSFVPTAHAFPEVAVRGLLRDYQLDDLAVSGDVDRARELLAQSTYDSDGDGRCDGTACAVSANRIGNTSDAAVDIITAGLAQLGIGVEWVEEPTMTDPTGHIAIGAIFGWVADYPSANDFAILMSDPGPEGFNPSLLGATPEQLEEWGYSGDPVPSLDEKITGCRARGGSAAFECWAELDQLVSEQVVAWVPVASSVWAYVIGSRIDRFQMSGSEAMPALDRIALSPDDNP